MSWIYGLAFGFTMNFLVGFTLKSLVFREYLPLPRAALTALVSLLFCVGAATFFGYYAFGFGIATFLFSTFFIAYLIPAFAHFLVLYYQMHLAWSYNDEDESLEQEKLDAKDRTGRSSAAIVSDE